MKFEELRGTVIMPELWDVLDHKGNKTGLTIERGKPMMKGQYHLGVQVWIVNGEGQYLAAKRTPHRNGLWHTVGGCVTTEDNNNSLKAAIREVREEIGVSLDANRGQLFTGYTIPHINDDGASFWDVWVFQQEVDISAAKLCPEETAEIKWAGKEQIIYMKKDGSFDYPYLDELFCFCEKLVIPQRWLRS